MAIMCVFSIFQIFAINTNAASREEMVYNFLRNDMGMNQAATCAVLANIYHESGFNPTNSYTEKDGAVSYGICQWNKGRRTNLEKYLKDNGYSTDSLTGQLKFMKKELEESYASVLKKIKGVENTSAGAYYGAYLWASQYEVCASKYYSDRTNTAVNTYWKKYGVKDAVSGFSTNTNSYFKVVFVTGVNESNATINGVFGSEKNISTDGFYIGTSENNLKKVSKNLAGNADGAAKCQSIYFGINKWYGTLEKGTKYYYKLYYMQNGKEYTSPVNWFVTKGVNVIPAPSVPVLISDKTQVKTGDMVKVSWKSCGTGINYTVKISNGDETIYNGNPNGELSHSFTADNEGSYRVNVTASSSDGKTANGYVDIVCTKRITADINGDGTVNSDDAVYLLKHTMIPENYPVSIHVDFDKNGQVNSDDAVYLLKHTMLPEQYPIS